MRYFYLPVITAAPVLLELELSSSLAEYLPLSVSKQRDGLENIETTDIDALFECGVGLSVLLNLFNLTLNISLNLGSSRQTAT